MEHLLSPVWSLADRRDLLLQLSFSEAHKDAWLKNVHTFWRNNHSIDNVLINYHPDLVDNEKVFNGRKVTTIQRTSYMVQKDDGQIRPSLSQPLLFTCRLL